MGGKNYKAMLEDAGDDKTKVKTANIDNLVSTIKTKGTNLKDGVLSDVETQFPPIDAALAAASASVSDCGFIAEIYTSFSGALCNNALEGLLWMTLSTMFVAWMMLPMIICAILVNVRMSGLGQAGKNLRDGPIGPGRPGTQARSVNP